MRVIVDTNIVFSALLNSNGKLARILLQPRTKLNFYSTQQLLFELDTHYNKLKKISKYSDSELTKVISIISRRIRFIDIELIPKETFIKALELTSDIDIDDTEFIALTEHIKGNFWSGDKALINGLQKKNWSRIITTDDLYLLVTKFKKR